MYPTSHTSYKLLYTFEKGNHGVFWAARIEDATSPSNGSVVCVKIISMLHFNKIYTIDDVNNEIKMVFRCNNPNLKPYYTSMINGKELWIV
jgi:hypothetical protein